jgi:hypothetical protein
LNLNWITQCLKSWNLNWIDKQKIITDTKIMRYILFLSAMLVLPQAFGSELFVRPDGGTWLQCNGETNTAYSAGITDKACAVNHIFELLEPQSQTVRIAGGDIVNILNNEDGTVAEYELGRHGEFVDKKCSINWAYDCHMPALPSGTKESPTRIRGEGWDTGCQNPPSLWGSGRAAKLFTIAGSENGGADAQYIELSCLELTDHSSCVGASGFPDSELRCDRSKPYDKPFADTGIYMIDATEITLTDLTIKGLSTGISAGRLGNVTLTRTHLFANHNAGWNGDVSGEDDDSVTGTILFDESAITFSGCALFYEPGTEKHNTPHGCVRQAIGGYGDGLGTGKTGGDWIFQDSKIMYNTSDGIDLLYHELGGIVTVKNSRIEGNGGNQLKITGNSEITNNIILGNCGWNGRQEEALGGNGENCRALGSALILAWAGEEDKMVVLNNTVVSEGDCLFQSGDRTKVGAVNQSLYAVNNIFYGVIDNHSNFENSCMYYVEPGEEIPNRQIHNNIIHQVKSYDSPCENFIGNKPTGNNANDGTCTSLRSGPFFDDSDYSIATNPHFLRLDLGIRHTAYDLETLEIEANKPYPKDTDSPSFNMGYTGAVDGIPIPTVDYLGNPRGSMPDIGATEYYIPPKPPVITGVEQVIAQ